MSCHYFKNVNYSTKFSEKREKIRLYWTFVYEWQLAVVEKLSCSFRTVHEILGTLLCLIPALVSWVLRACVFVCFLCFGFVLLWRRKHFLYSYIFVCMRNRVWIFATPWTVAHQAPLSMGFSRQEYGSGLPCPSPGELPNPKIELKPPALANRFFTTACAHIYYQNGKAEQSWETDLALQDHLLWFLSCPWSL